MNRLAGKPRIAALVPMRHESERVPGKNYRPLGGKPLFHHIVATLLSCQLIDEVAIDTDSRLIADDCRANFPEVRLIDRPKSLVGGEVPMNDILLHDTSVIEADLFLQTHSTNPLLEESTVSAAIGSFLSDSGGHDSLFTVTALQTRLWTPEGKAINHDPEVLLRTQDLPPVMEENSCLYLFDRATLVERGNRIGSNPVLHAIDPLEAWDIDDEADWAVVEALHARRDRTITGRQG